MQPDVSIVAQDTLIRRDSLSPLGGPTSKQVVNQQNDFLAGLLLVDQQNDRVWASSLFTERRVVTRRQNPQSVMVWAAVTETGRSPLLFVPSGVKFNSQRYIAEILEGCLLPWTKKHFQGVPWSLQQDSAPSHVFKITQSSFQKKIPSFISKEVWSARSPDLNPLDFSMWSILEIKAYSSPHPTVEALKAKLLKEWADISQETIRGLCLVLSQIEGRS